MTYTAYYMSLESSAVRISDDLEELKKPWCFGMAIFETPGLTEQALQAQFPNPDQVKRGAILKWLEQNYKEVHREGLAPNCSDLLLSS